MNDPFHIAEDSVLTQKIEVGVTTGTGIDNGGKVPREIVCVTAEVVQRKCKGHLQSGLGCPDEPSVFPRLAVNRHFPTRNNCIQKRLAITRAKEFGFTILTAEHAFHLKAVNQVPAFTGPSGLLMASG